MDILIPDIAIIEKVVRSQVVYVFLLVAFRVAGKRQPDQLTAFDLVVLLIISTVLHHKRLQRMVENVPTVLGRHAHVLHGNLDREHLSMAELRVALRTEGIATMSAVRYAILEEDERVSVIPRSVLPA